MELFLLTGKQVQEKLILWLETLIVNQNVVSFQER